MKKIFFTFLCLIAFNTFVLADDKADILKIFDNYVNDANSYSKNLPDYYTKNAKIVRVVNRKQGGQQSVIIPFDRYLKELDGNAILAKTVGYKNRYVNRKITKINKDYRISAIRIPRNDKKGLPSYFIFTKEEGTWKIKEESMTTNVQKFLTAK